MLNRLRSVSLMLLIVFTLELISPIRAFADVYGRLSFSVKDADTEKPLAAATITLHDTGNVEADVTLTTDDQGAATSPQLENRSWRITTHITGYDDDTRTIAVAPDTTTPVEVDLDKQEKVIKITSGRDLVRSGNATDTTDRNQSFIQKYPATGGNPQSLPRLLVTNPGFVQSSVNVVHPRGEHASTSIYINGFLLPGTLQGRAGQQISPTIIDNADIQTGGFSPEYGSETAAILNLSLRAGPINPFQNFTVQGGGFNTFFGEATVGGQGGATLTPGVEGPAPRRFRYFMDFTDRTTDNALEAPQPDDQTAHNGGGSATLFGNLGYTLTPKDDLDLVVNAAPAQTEIANRTGLSGKYAPVGQGYGYGGARDADGSEPGADPTLIGGQTIPGLKSQQADGQDINQTDSNEFGLLNYRHTFNSDTSGLLSVGFNHSGLDIRNNNPLTDLQSINPDGTLNANVLNPDGTLQAIDNSIEYNPTLSRSYNQYELAGSVTQAVGTHTFKEGFTANQQDGSESYQFIAGSQLALDSLAAVQVNGPQLTPNGTYETDSKGNAVLDALGNQVYLVDPKNPSTPTVNVHRSGYYAAGYAQDTWRATSKLTLNYGLRLDYYTQKQSLSSEDVNTAYLSPRLNAAYAITPRTIARVSYNKLFSQPPLAQGAILGTPLKPQITDLYDVSMERQFSDTQTGKISLYYKNARNEFDTGILIPYTQIGAYTTLQYSNQGVHGLELSYDVNPRNNIGLGGYVTYTNSLAKPGGVDQTGAPAPEINDHDQRNTVSAGLNYTFQSQASAGLDYYYGSGETSSILAPIGPSNTNLLNGGNRNSNSEVNLRFTSSPKMLGVGSLALDIENLFDSRDVLNFNSGFSGTRFQEGRRVLLSFNSSF